MNFPADLASLIRDGDPLVGTLGITVESVGTGVARLRLPCRGDLLRPGGTITGPAMFSLADVALRGAVLSLIGRVELAVTTSATIDFLRRPPPVAHANGTHSIPPHEPVSVTVSKYQDVGLTQKIFSNQQVCSIGIHIPRQQVVDLK